jgi:hypothetical protein
MATCEGHAVSCPSLEDRDSTLGSGRNSGNKSYSSDQLHAYGVRRPERAFAHLLPLVAALRGCPQPLV